MIREPPAAPRVKVVVADPVPTGRRVEETSVARVYRDVTDPSTLLEEQQVANGQGAGGDRDAGAGHLSRGARKIDAVQSVYVLNESGAIKPGAR